MARNPTQHAGDRPADPKGDTRPAMHERELANARAGRIDRAPRVAPSSSRLPFIPVKPRRTAQRQARNAGVGAGVGSGRQVTLDSTAPSVANVNTTQVRSLTAYCAESAAPQVRNQVPAQPVNGPATPGGQGQDMIGRTANSHQPHPAIPRGDGMASEQVQSWDDDSDLDSLFISETSLSPQPSSNFDRITTKSTDNSLQPHPAAPRSKGTASQQVNPQNLPLFFPKPSLYPNPPNFGSITTNTPRIKPINIVNKPVKKRVKKQVTNPVTNPVNDQEKDQENKQENNHGNNYRGNDVVKRTFSNPKMRAIFSGRPTARPRKAGNQPTLKMGVRRTIPGEIVPEDTDEDNDKEDQQNKRAGPFLPPRNPRA